MSYSIPKTSGIYKITCIATGKSYIGSSNNLRHRWYKHLGELNKNKHTNQYLQHAWNKYGEKAFVFEVIEYVMPFVLLDREQYWLDTLKTYNKDVGFNIARNANAPQLGIPVSPEHRAKISIAKKGIPLSPERKAKAGKAFLGKSHTPEARARIAKGNQGRIKSIEECQKISAAKKGIKPSPQTEAAKIAAHVKSYIVTSPSGEEIKITNLSNFCREHGLTIARMSALANGINNHHKGWKCRHDEG